MSQKTYLEQYPPIALRNYYREKILNNQANWFLGENNKINFPPLHKRGWCRYYAIPDFVYSYFRLLALGSEIVEQILEINHRDYSLSAEDKRPLLLSLMEFDFHRVILPIAITAWLTVDEFRWDVHIPNIPHDLNYGLVSQYPEAICAYAAFIGNFNRSQFLDLLCTATVNKSEILAAKEVSRQIGKPYKINQFKKRIRANKL